MSKDSHCVAECPRQLTIKEAYRVSGHLRGELWLPCKAPQLKAVLTWPQPSWLLSGLAFPPAELLSRTFGTPGHPVNSTGKQRVKKSRAPSDLQKSREGGGLRVSHVCGE